MLREKFESVKTHVKENKTAYIVGGSVAVGVVVGVVLTKSAQVSISNPALVNYKPVANTVQVQMTRPGPKSFVVQCLETQEVFPSIRQAGESLGVSPSVISGHLRGKLSDASGLHFMKLSEV